MASDARLRPFRALDHTRLLDGSPLGVPQAVESNPLLEEIGFERDVTFDASAEGPELVSPNKTQEGADEASRQAERTHETPDALLPRATAETLAALLANQRRREPEDGDVPFFAANRAPNVAAGAQAAVLEFELEPETELYIASIGTDATDGQDEVEITLGGRLAYRGLFSPMTLAEARAGRFRAELLERLDRDADVAHAIGERRVHGNRRVQHAVQSSRRLHAIAQDVADFHQRSPGIRATMPMLVTPAPVT